MINKVGRFFLAKGGKFVWLFHGLPVCLYARPSEQSVEKHGHMADVIYLNTEALLAGKKSFHILHTNRRNTEQMVSIGTRHNTCHLFLRKITLE